jgi:hypothetical protein
VSLILDALNRSRNDAQQVPGLATSYLPASGPRAGGWRAWLLPGALAVAVLLIIWLLWERSGGQAAPPSVELSSPADPGAAAIAPAPVPAPPPAEPAPAATPAIESVPVAGALVATRPAPALSATATERDAEAAAGGVELPGSGNDTPTDSAAIAAEDPGAGSGSASASASVAALYRQQQLAQPEVPSAGSEATVPAVSAAAEPAAPDSRAIREQPIDIGEMLQMAEDELENVRLAEHPAPFLSALSQQTKDTIPTLLYQAHDYNSGKADSFVLINGKKLKQGDSSKGVRVDEILPDSVVLSFQGTQFRLRALNSWVNL